MKNGNIRGFLYSKAAVWYISYSVTLWGFMINEIEIQMKLTIVACLAAH